MRTAWNAMTAVVFVSLAVIGWLVAAMLGCSGSVNIGGGNAECGVDSLEGTYQTETLDRFESDIATRGENGIPTAADVDGPFDIVSNVRIDRTGFAEFNETWTQRNSGDTVEFRATGVVRLNCVGDELSSYVLDWGPTTVIDSSIPGDGFLNAFERGTTALDSGPDSVVTIDPDDVNGGRVIRLDVTGPGPMADGERYRLR